MHQAKCQIGDVGHVVLSPDGLRRCLTERIWVDQIAAFSDDQTQTVGTRSHQGEIAILLTIGFR